MYHYITYFEIAAFLASLAAIRTLSKSRYLRWFPLLLFVVISVEIYETFFTPPSRFFNDKIYNAQVPLQYIIYMIILYYATLRNSYKRIILAGIFIYIAAAVVTEIYFVPAHHFNVWSYSMGSALVIIFILAKFYEMLQNPATFNFLRDPFFYMLFAFLLFNIGTLPYFSMSNWLYFVKGYKDAGKMLANVMSVLNYILYTTYIISFIWMIRKKDYS